MPDQQPTPAPESAAPVASDSQPAAPSSGPDTTGLSSEVRQALQDAYPRDAVEAPSGPREPAAEPATEVVPEAAQEPESGPDDEAPPPEAAPETPGEPKLSRAQREAARRQAEVDQAVAAALAAREQAAQAQAELEARNADDQRVMQRAAELMGSGEDENALIDAVANGDFEAADRLKLLRQRRADSAVVITAADRLAWGKVYAQIQTAREIKGTDGAVLDRVNSLPEVFRHIESAVEARVKADYEGRLERQKADYESRLGRAASGLPTTESGGRAVGTPSQITQADLDRMLANGDWQAYERLTPQQKAQIR